MDLKGLIEEIPAETEAEDTVVEGIVGGKKILPVTASGIYMTHHDEETCML